MASSKINVTDLDFAQIKSNLKTFLKAQSEFQDYNFEGSGLSVLLDTLSYNTHYMAFLANMATNEVYLDSADIRKNIVSLAKMLGYTPSSSRAPRANVDIVVNSASGTTLTMNKGTIFNSVVDDTTYQYVTNAETTIIPQNGVYRFSDVILYEGSLVTFKYTVDSQDVDQKFIIPTNRADTSTLKVSVQNSSTDTTVETYTLATSYADIDNESKVFFIQETDSGRFEVYFGDGVTGKKLTDGNIVILEYIVTNQEESNGASKFSLQGTIGGFGNVSITVNSSSQGGSVPESNESVKFNAPFNYSLQNRAVTTKDYESHVRRLYPNALSVSVWGGEDEETPIYGVVKISIKPKSGATLTQATKTEIISKLKQYNVASVRPEITEPESTFINMIVKAKFNSNLTTKSKETISTDIINAIKNYNTNTLQRFDGIFRYSKVVGLIDDTDNSIVSNTTTLTIKKLLTPTLNASTKYDIYFRNALYNPHSGHNASAGGILTSTGFKIDGNNNEMFLDEDGMGNVRRYYMNAGIKVYENINQGTIDYETGTVTVNSLNIASVSNIRGKAATSIEIIVEPLSRDIVPVRNQVIEVDTDTLSVISEADTFAGGSAQAGVGYTTTSGY